MTREQLAEILRRPAVAALNPHLGAVASPEHSKPAPTLERDLPPKQSSQGGMGVRVTIIGLRRRKLDDDNFAAGAKPLRDAIAKSLLIDDGSDRIRFEYGQVVSAGAEGSIVRIEWL